MSLSDSSLDNQANTPQMQSTNEEHDDNSDDQIPLPPRIPLNYKKVSKKKGNLPVLDSEALFQSTNINTNDSDPKSTISFNNARSSQLHLLSFKNDSKIFDGSGSIEHFSTEQYAAKQPDFSPADIDVDNYFLDLFKRELNSPQITSKEDFFTTVEPDSIENYAKHNFRKRSFFFFNSQNLHQITTFSDKPLTKPLLEKVPLSKKLSVEVLSYQILTFIGVIKAKKKEGINQESIEEKRDNLLITIVCTLHDDETLIDECLMQLIKETREPPSDEKLILTWKLFLIILSLFFISDQKVRAVVRWFLVQKIFNGDMEAKYARFAFIKLYERNVIERNFDNMTREEIIHIPLGVSYGKKMFKTSLFAMMWNQKRKFPHLPIPLTVFLVVKTLIKNGVLMTKRPFPMLEGKYSGKMKSDAENEALKQANNNKCIIENENKNEFEENYEIEEIEENLNENQNENKNENNQDQDNKNSNENEENDNNDNENSKINSNEMDEILVKFKNKRRRANFIIIKSWTSKLSSNYDIINDGEVCDLFGFLMIWMLNLLDPIVPKSMTQLFLETFSVDPAESGSSDKYRNFVYNMPLLHLNTLKYLIGFLREIAQNEKFTLENHRTIADDLSSYFVNTSFATVDPFTRQRMTDIAPRFLFYCLENLDVSDLYPLNPLYAITKEESE